MLLCLHAGLFACLGVSLFAGFMNVSLCRFLVCLFPEDSISPLDPLDKRIPNGHLSSSEVKVPRSEGVEPIRGGEEGLTTLTISKHSVYIFYTSSNFTTNL